MRTCKDFLTCLRKSILQQMNLWTQERGSLRWNITDQIILAAESQLNWCKIAAIKLITK